MYIYKSQINNVRKGSEPLNFGLELGTEHRSPSMWQGESAFEGYRFLPNV